MAGKYGYKNRTRLNNAIDNKLFNQLDKYATETGKDRSKVLDEIIELFFVLQPVLDKAAILKNKKKTDLAEECRNFLLEKYELAPFIENEETK